MKRLTVIIISLFFTGQISAQKDNHSNFVFKFSPTQIAAGELHFEFERALGKQMSFTVNAGPTLSEFGIPPIGNYGLGAQYSENTTTPRKSSVGGFVGVGLRFYPLKNYSTAVRSFYFGPELKFRMYNSKYDTSNVPTYMTDIYDTKFQVLQSSLRIQAGYQFRFNNNFSLEMYANVGVGLSNIKSNEIRAAYTLPGNTQNYENYNSNKKTTYLAGTWGVKIGFGCAKKN